MRIYVLARHGQSTLNAEHRVNGDPAVAVPLTALGLEQARLLGAQLAGLPLELYVHSRFGRTRETAEAALADREVPLAEEPLLDDIRIGSLEGRPIAEYRAWKRGRSRDDEFPGGGESLNDAARRYARAYRRLLARPERRVLVVCHEIPVRYALNGAAGSADLDGPAHGIANATPYVFDEAALERAVAAIERAAG